MPTLEQIEEALVTSATKVKHTTKAQRASSLCKRPPDLKLAQNAIFNAKKGLERQEARKHWVKLKQVWESQKLQCKIGAKPKMHQLLHLR